MKHLVFVYGTLKRGFHNHGLLKASDFEGPGYVRGSLYVRGLPYFKNLGAGKVYGELYRIDNGTLARLDRLEGYDRANPEASFYKRIVVDTAVGDEKGYYIEGYDPAYIYEYTGNVEEKYLNKEGIYNG